MRSRSGFASVRLGQRELRHRARRRRRCPTGSITAEQRAFWSFQPLATARSSPAVSHGGWAKSEIDRSCWRDSRRRVWRRSWPADKRTLIRRATLDLTGLPPTPEEIEAFEKDGSPDAFAKVVDRLLASPQYGERGDALARRRALRRRRSAQPRSRRDAATSRIRTRTCIATGWSRPSTTICRTTSSSRRSWLAICWTRSTCAATLPALGFLGLGPVVLRQRIGRNHARRRAARSGGRGVARLPRPDRRVRALPRSQVRPDPAKDYYALAGVFLNIAVPRVSAGAEGGRGGVRRAGEEGRAEGEAARRVHWRPRAGSSPRRWRFSASSYMQCGLEGDRRAEEGRGARRQRGQARLRAVRALGPLPGQAAEVLSRTSPSGRR